MEDESANEMDSNHPLPSHHHHHHHMEPMLNDSRKRTNHQTGNYHTTLGMVDSLAQQQNFVPGKSSTKKNIQGHHSCSICLLFVVHGATVIDASSSPSPPSTYSPQSSPSESRHSPNASGKHSSTKYSNSGTSASSHGASHHNDLSGTASASNRLNGNGLVFANEFVCVCHFQGQF